MHAVARRSMIVAFAGFTVLAALMLWPALAPHAADRLAIGGADGDFLRQFYPYRAFVARSLAGGRVPLWNPHQYAGTPALADPQLAVAYPLRLLQALPALGGRVLPVWAVTLEAVFHLALAGLLTTFLARALGARPGAAILAGTAFAAGGYATGYPLDQLAIIGSAAWIPGALAGLVLALRSDDALRRRRLAALAGAASALSVLAGHGQTAAFGALTAVALIASGLRSRRRPAAAVAVVWAACALALSAVQWLPTLDLLARASRSVSTADVLAGLPVADIGQLLVPHLLSCWSPLYVGVVPLALAVWGAWAAPRARPWLALAGAGWLWALGGNGPLVPLLVRIIPAMDAFRHQERAAVVVAIGLTVAAGLAADRAVEEAAAGRARGLGRGLAAAAATLAIGAAVLAVIPSSALAGAPLARFCGVESGAALAGRIADGLAMAALWAALAAGAVALARRGVIGARGLSAALVAVVVLELVAANGRHALGPVGPWPPSDALLAALAPRARDGRVSSEGLLPGGPNGASIHGLYDATGDSPLALRNVADLVADAPEMAWWRLLGVRYLVTRRALGPAEQALLTPLASEGDRTLYEIALPAPPTWAVVGRPETAGADWLPDAALDPSSVVVLTDGPATDPGALPALADVPPAVGARLEGLDAGTARVAADLPAAGVVVLATAWDPGWRARATGPDGRAHRPRVRQAYGALLAVELGAGAWRVEWTYLPRPVMVGALLSGLAWVLLAVVLMAWGGLRWPGRQGPSRRR